MYVSTSSRLRRLCRKKMTVESSMAAIKGLGSVWYVIIGCRYASATCVSCMPVTRTPGRGPTCRHNRTGSAIAVNLPSPSSTRTERTSRYSLAYVLDRADAAAWQSTYDENEMIAAGSSEAG